MIHLKRRLRLHRESFNRADISCTVLQTGLEISGKLAEKPHVIRRIAFKSKAGLGMLSDGVFETKWRLREGSCGV